MEHLVESINTNRKRKVSRVLAFLGLICNLFKEKSEDFRWKGWNIEEEFVYLR